MKVIRPIEKKDQESFERMAFTSGPGITNLPKDASLLKERIAHSIEAFNKTDNKLEDNFYIFVLEDLVTKQIEGTSGIRSKTGIKEPLFFYQKENIVLNSHSKEIPILRPNSYLNGPSELIGLYLFPQNRKAGAGHLLSLSRLMFIATFPKRFDSSLKAEIRGWIEENHHCPFWEGIGRHFLDIPLDEILKKIINDRNFIQKILPPFPIIVPLLPKEVQSVIGVTHPHTVPAQKMLEKEGFSLTGEIDVIDGGPVLLAEVKEIKTIKNSSVKKIKEIKSVVESEKHLISNERLDFRACFSPLIIENNDVIIPQETAQALRVNNGESVRVLK